MRNRKPESKPTGGVETFGGTYHRFESVFEPKTEKPSPKAQKKNVGKGKRGKGTEQ